jgi:signal transduction histidine kinase/CheY-like chemotaxis protein
MWQILNHSEERIHLATSAQDLLEETMRTLIYTLGGLWLLFQIVLTAHWTGIYDWQTWPLTAAYLLLSGMVLYLLPGRLYMAQVLWLLGIGLLITLGLVLLGIPEIAFLYALIPFIAVVVTNWRLALLLILGIAGLLWGMAAEVAPSLLTPLYALFVILAATAAASVGWATSHVVLTVIQWSLYSFAQAKRHTEEAREHRAELARLYKDLDQAYYQLERANASLVVARERAEEAERFKTEFVTNVSHELRTPLNLIVGFTEMMMTSPESYGHVPLPGAYRGDLHSVYHSAQHLLALVDDVLDLARIEVGRIALAREDVELHALVTETSHMVRDYITAKGLKLEICVEEDLPVLQIDRLRIRQVLLNLLVNAARHTSQGWIAIRVRRQGAAIHFEVQDTGPGIPDADLSKIFEEFRTTEHPFSEWHSGTGLGLPISKKFVELHGGTMGVESKLGQGASFWFTLPLADADCIAVNLRSERFHPLVRLDTPENVIVVVHRDRHVATLLKRYMNGYQVIGVEDLDEGIRLAEEIQAVALLIDNTEEREISTTTMVIRCPLPNTQSVATDLGVEELLVKPVSRHELLAAVDRLNHPIERALIVDDDPEVVRLFRRMLRTRVPVHNILEAYNGAEALQRLEEERPDLVLLDLVMPEVDGHTVLSKMAIDPRFTRIPVILISAKGQDHINLRLSGSVKISKPDGFELGEIVQALKATCDALAPGIELSKFQI